MNSPLAPFVRRQTTAASPSLLTATSGSERVPARFGERDRRLPTPARGLQRRGLDELMPADQLIPGRDRFAAGVHRQLRRTAFARGFVDRDRRLPRAGGAESHGRLDHPGRAGVALPDDDRVAGGVDCGRRVVGVLARGREIDRRLPAAARAFSRGRLDDFVASVRAPPDGHGVTGGVDRQARRRCRVPCFGEVDRRLPAATRCEPGRGLQDFVAAVRAIPDSDRIAGRVECEPDVGGVSARRREGCGGRHPGRRRARAGGERQRCQASRQGAERGAQAAAPDVRSCAAVDSHAQCIGDCDERL